MENLPQHIDNNIQHQPEFNTNDLIDQFIADTQNLKEASKIRYRKSLKRYFEWVSKSRFHLSKITLTELLIYKSYLSEQKTKEGTLLSKFTVGAYLNAIKLFYEWANGKGLMFNPAKSLKAPKREKKFKKEPLNLIQQKQLLEHFKKTSLRNFAMCNLMIRCGLRTIEVCRLDISDLIIRSGKQILMIQGKGKDEKDNWVKITDKTYIPLIEYIGNRTDGPIFISESITGVKSRLIPGTVSKIIKAGLREIGIDVRNITAHSLRHTTATNLLLNGATMEQTQETLRHADSRTTEGYTSTVKEILRLEKKSGEEMMDDIL